MEYEFHLQDPTSPSTVYLFEAIIGAVKGANRWRGMFAFATRRGVDALLLDPEVEAFLRHGSMSLVIGLDAITNRATLERLRELENAIERLEVRVFWNKNAGLFHPKISHFCYPDGRSAVIVGSGNLTPGGLRENFEAFSIIKLRPRERVNLSAWERFFQDHGGDIRAIDDAALERAARNIVRRTRPTVREEPEPDTGVPSIVESPQLIPTVPAEAEEPVYVVAVGLGRVLLASVPKAGGRWHQAHFNRDAIEKFFRVQPNSVERVYLTECRQDGSFGDQEVRPCVYSASNKNHKIELSSHRGVDYPLNGKPIAVFRELQVRSFAYMLLMPGENGYREMDELLGRLPSLGRGDPRVITDVNELKRAWSTCPLVTRVGVPTIAN